MDLWRLWRHDLHSSALVPELHWVGGIISHHRQGLTSVQAVDHCGHSTLYEDTLRNEYWNNDYYLLFLNEVPSWARFPHRPAEGANMWGTFMRKEENWEKCRFEYNCFLHIRKIQLLLHFRVCTIWLQFADDGYLRLEDSRPHGVNQPPSTALKSSQATYPLNSNSFCLW